MFNPITINDVEKALTSVGSIERPYGDNEGDAINSRSIFPELTEEEKWIVNNAVNTIEEYIDGYDGYPDKRAISRIQAKGIDISIGPDQNDPYKSRGKVNIGEWDINLNL